MKVLVFGAGGQLGREWAAFLKHQDIPYEAFGSAEVDITDVESLEQAVQGYRPDTVVNCAAYTAVDEAEEDRDRALLVNATAVSGLARLCREYGACLVHYSTDYIFAGDEEDREQFPEGYPEDADPDPINWYGETKLRGEKAIREALDAYIIIRTSWLCGQHGTNFVKTMLRLGKERESLAIVNDQWGAPSYAKNVVRNSFNLARTGKNGIFNVTSEGLTTWFGFAQEIFDQAGIRVEVEPVSSESYPARAKRPAFSKLSTERLEQVSGSEIIDWKDGLSGLLVDLGIH